MQGLPQHTNTSTFISCLRSLIFMRMLLLLCYLVLKGDWLLFHGQPTRDYNLKLYAVKFLSEADSKEVSKEDLPEDRQNMQYAR